MNAHPRGDGDRAVKGKLRGRKPKLSDEQAREVRRMHDTGAYSISDIAELLSISRATVYRMLIRIPPAPTIIEAAAAKRVSGAGDADQA